MTRNRIVIDKISHSYLSTGQRIWRVDIKMTKYYVKIYYTKVLLLHEFCRTSFGSFFSLRVVFKSILRACCSKTDMPNNKLIY